MAVSVRLAIASVFVTAFSATAPAAAESMKSAVRHAIKTNPTGLARAAGTRAIAHDVEAARSEFNAKIDVFGEVGAQRVDNENSLSASDNDRWRGARQVGVSASYLLYDGYRRANRLYREGARLDGAVYGLLSTKETVALNAVEAYVDVVRHRDLIHIARRNIDRHIAIQRQINARVEGGKSPTSDRFQIEERVFAARAVLVEIQKAYADAVAKYQKVVGRKPGRKMRIANAGKLPRSKEALVQRSIANNYSVQAAQKQINQNEYAVDAAEGEKLPELGVNGRATWGGDRNGSRGTETDVYVGLRLSWRLYDGGVRDAQVGAATARVTEARFQLDERRRDVAELARRSWNAYSDGRLRASLLSKQVEANKKIVRNYLEEYELSKRSLLDVLDGERALFNTRFQYQSVRAAYRFATFRMKATQSRLAKFFGVSAGSIAPTPNVENRLLNSGGDRPLSSQRFFNVNIEPLK
ncbi:putative type I secretion outer membrane protein, TolC [Ahrensia sp. R2A130]|nr:putative type I secretion outer membrane protein, TolC [Ahrensia sp. R2A130]